MVQINWNDKGYFYLFPKNAQEDVLKTIGREQYIKLPKQGTNPRGVEMSGKAIEELSKHKDTKVIEVDWKEKLLIITPTTDGLTIGLKNNYESNKCLQSINRRTKRSWKLIACSN